uniref:SLPTX10 n=1 Tax=Hemiscolopendra marginata TaxID=943146 RepID=A0A646QF41_9MYRI
MSKLTIIFVLALMVICMEVATSEKLPQSFLDALKLAKGDKKAEGMLYTNRSKCMSNCGLIPTCPKLAPECCPKKTADCPK